MGEEAPQGLLGADAPQSLGRAAVEDSVMRRATRNGGLSAILMFAGRDRTRALRRRVPQSDRGLDQAIGHRSFGDRSCSGGCPAHDGGLAHSQPGVGESNGVLISGGHLRPHEARQLPSNGGHDELAVGLASIETTELGAQALLG